MARCGGPAMCPGMSSSSVQRLYFSSYKAEGALEYASWAQCKLLSCQDSQAAPVTAPNRNNDRSGSCCSKQVGQALRNWHFRYNTVYVQAS